MTCIVDSFHMDKAEIVPILILNELCSCAHHFTLEVRVVVPCHALDVVEQVHPEGAANSTDNCRWCDHEWLQTMLLLETRLIDRYSCTS